MRNLPSQKQINLFNEALDEGWSIVVARHRARLTGVQYMNMRKDPVMEANIQKIKQSYMNRSFNKTGTPVAEFLVAKPRSERSLREEARKIIKEQKPLPKVEIRYDLPLGSRPLKDLNY